MCGIYYSLILDYTKYNTNCKTMDVTRRKTIIITLIVAGLLLIRSRRQRKQRRWWVKPWISRRSEKGSLHLVDQELKIEDTEYYKNFLRMDHNCFKMLLSHIEPDISKQNTRLRECISPRAKLIITLRFLATGESYRSLMYQFRVSESTISIFVPQVCRCIYQTLKGKYLHVPTTAAEWLNISQHFENRWNMPNVIAAMDGKHIVFQAPKSAGSTFYNYKGTNSIVLLALVDADYKFLYIDVGTNGRISDGGVFLRSDLNVAIQSNTLNIPEEKPLPGREKCVPHVIVADAAFPLTRNILKPYPFRNMSREQQIFNYRLSRARNVVENTFGIFANRFRILLTTINLSPDKVEIITLACCALHNFLRENSQSYMPTQPENEIDQNYTFVHGLSQQTGNRHRTEALEARHEFMEYVNGVGSVPWQNNM